MTIWDFVNNAAFLSFIGGLILGILGAIYTPYFAELIKTHFGKKKLRKALYSELVYLYELAKFYTKVLDRESKQHYFTTDFKDESQLPSDRISRIATYSLRQSMAKPQIWRSDLRRRLSLLRFTVSCLEKVVRNTLYDATLSDPDQTKLFYELDDRFPMRTTYENFVEAIEYECRDGFTPQVLHFLTSEESTELACLDARCYFIKKALIDFDEDELDGELDPRMLDNIRGGTQKKGTLVWEADTPSKASKWCTHCKKYVLPVKHARWNPPMIAWLTNRLTRSTCGYCDLKDGAKLLNPKEHIRDQIAKLKDERASERQNALETLGDKCIHWLEDKDVQNVSSIIQIDQDDAFRACAVTLVGKLCAVDAGLAITRALKNDRAWQMLESAAWAAGEIYRGRKQAYDVAPLLKTLKPERSEVRTASAEALGKVGNNDAFAALADVVSNKNEDQNVRLNAIDALGRFGQRAIDPCLSN